MLAEDQWKQIRPIRWKKGQRPEFRLSVTGVTREDERQLRKTAKGMGLSFSLSSPYSLVLSGITGSSSCPMVPSSTS